MRMKAEQRREALLEAALRAFAERGYDGSTTKRIAEATGVTEAVLFRHFPTKRDLFRAVIEHFGPARVLMPSSDALRALPLSEAVRRLVADYMDALWAHGDWLRLAWQESAPDSQARERLREQFRAVRRALRDLLSERAVRREIRPDRTEGAVTVITTSVRGFLRMMAYLHPPEWPSARDRFLGNLMPILLDGIRLRIPCDESTARQQEGTK